MNLAKYIRIIDDMYNNIMYASSPKENPLYAAFAKASVRHFTSPKPKLSPMPANGWIRCAASLQSIQIH